MAKSDNNQSKKGQIDQLFVEFEKKMEELSKEQRDLYESALKDAEKKRIEKVRKKLKHRQKP